MHNRRKLLLAAAPLLLIIVALAAAIVFFPNSFDIRNKAAEPRQTYSSIQAGSEGLIELVDTTKTATTDQRKTGEQIFEVKFHGNLLPKAQYQSFSATIDLVQPSIDIKQAPTATETVLGESTDSSGPATLPYAPFPKPTVTDVSYGIDDPVSIDQYCFNRVKAMGSNLAWAGCKFPGSYSSLSQCPGNGQSGFWVLNAAELKAYDAWKQKGGPINQGCKDTSITPTSTVVPTSTSVPTKTPTVGQETVVLYSNGIVSVETSAKLKSLLSLKATYVKDTATQKPQLVITGQFSTSDKSVQDLLKQNPSLVTIRNIQTLPIKASISKKSVIGASSNGSAIKELINSSTSPTPTRIISATVSPKPTNINTPTPVKPTVTPIPGSVCSAKPTCQSGATPTITGYDSKKCPIYSCIPNVPTAKPTITPISITPSPTRPTSMPTPSIPMSQYCWNRVRAVNGPLVWAWCKFPGLSVVQCPGSNQANSTLTDVEVSEYKKWVDSGAIVSPGCEITAITPTTTPQNPTVIPVSSTPTPPKPTVTPVSVTPLPTIKPTAYPTPCNWYDLRCRIQGTPTPTVQKPTPTPTRPTITPTPCNWYDLRCRLRVTPTPTMPKPTITPVSVTPTRTNPSITPTRIVTLIPTNYPTNLPRQVCAEIYDPVCGTDGKTYSNACEAGLVNVPVASRGVCSSGRTPTPWVTNLPVNITGTVPLKEEKPLTPTQTPSPAYYTPPTPCNWYDVVCLLRNATSR